MRQLALAFAEPRKVNLYDDEFNRLFEQARYYRSKRTGIYVSVIPIDEWVKFRAYGLDHKLEPGDYLIDDNIERHGEPKGKFEKEYTLEEGVVPFPTF